MKTEGTGKSGPGWFHGKVCELKCKEHYPSGWGVRSEKVRGGVGC